MIPAVVGWLVRDGFGSQTIVGLYINTALNDPDTIWVTELWTDKQAHDATTRSGPVTPVTRRLLELLVAQPAGSYGHAVHIRGRTSD
jgi:hypothetical protein